jgi:glycerate kinase
VNGEAAPVLLAAPDSFKGTFSASEVASAIAAGAERRGWRADVCPVADGGEGTMDVLVAAQGGEVLEARVTGPLGEPVIAKFALLPDRVTAIVEMAQASGLGLVPADQRDAERASTFGTGELILAARDVGARLIVVTVGGSATTDGGLGAIDAIGRGGGLGGAALTVLCDVAAPYELAASVFGPQKGADPDAVERLTARLNDAAVHLPRDPRGEPWTGCAGGLSGGLWAAFGAQLVPGAAAVLDAVGFDARLANSDTVVTGEGRIDAQSLDGKITGEIVWRCVRASVPVHAIVGRNGLEPEPPAVGLSSVTEAGTLQAIERTAAELVERLEARTSSAVM